MSVRNEPVALRGPDRVGWADGSMGIVYRCVVRSRVRIVVPGAGVTGPEPMGAPVPLFMDVHSIGGRVSAEDIADAHARDLEHQHKHGVNYLRYWVDEQAGKLFCLVEAPCAEAACEVHREAHGLVADEIYLVSEYS